MQKEFPMSVFVVHKHQASRLHYDFRLEIGGALASWAVPKGPSLVPSMKRLAVRVDDHALDYGGFEGVIPADDYGGGPVMIWDEGEVVWPKGKTPEAMLEAGTIEFELKGKKLMGAWRLVHAKLGGQEKNWLLVKRTDAHAETADDVLTRLPNSARTGRTMEEISGQNQP
jgi:bifunctional non-homologous end joining protein LigD